MVTISTAVTNMFGILPSKTSKRINSPNSHARRFSERFSENSVKNRNESPKNSRTQNQKTMDPTFWLYNFHIVTSNFVILIRKVEAPYAQAQVVKVVNTNLIMPPSSHMVPPAHTKNATLHIINGMTKTATSKRRTIFIELDVTSK